MIGYEMGADDYVTKPFSIKVFQKKIEVILRRSKQLEEREIYKDGHLELDFVQMKSSIDGEELFLTALEYRILKLFIENANKVLTRKVLLEKLWDSEENYVDEHTLTAGISRLRKKIEREKNYIKTIYGMGYSWIGERNGELPE